MTFALYRALWWLLGPLVLLLSALHPRLRGALAERWSVRLPAVEPGAIWVHAASVGEGTAASAMLDALAARTDAVLFRTAFTDTGIATAKGHHSVGALVFDHPLLVRRFLDRLRPSVLVLIEAELWPCLLAGCHARGIPVVVAGSRPQTGLQRIPGLFAVCAEAVTIWLSTGSQGPVPGAQPIGELKLDAPIGAAEDAPEGCLIAASTRPGDEARVIEAWRSLSPRPQLVIAPRHAARFDEVAALTGGGRRSQGDAPGELFLLDTIGELAGWYPRAAAVVMGGTWDPEIGGHSPAEAFQAGCPVVHGPYIQGEVWSAGTAIPAGEELAPALERALGLGRQPVVRGGAASKAADRVLELRGALPPERPYRPMLRPLVPVVALFRRRPGDERTPKLPVVSVGNLASGGSGKTPVAAWLANTLGQLGLRPAVVARGYGRQPHGPPVRLPMPGRDASWLGDELTMLNRMGLPVVSSPDRLVGVQVAAASGAQVAVLDDAFQQRGISKALDIAVVDGVHPRAGGPIPLGDAREDWAALERADLIWITRGPVPDGLDPARVVHSRLRARAWHHDGAAYALDALPLGPVLAVASIARPGRFLEQLATLGIRPQRWWARRDHQGFSAEDLKVLSEWPGPVVCTEKDLARLPAGLPVWALLTRLEFCAGEEIIRARLRTLIGDAR